MLGWQPKDASDQICRVWGGGLSNGCCTLVWRGRSSASGSEPYRETPGAKDPARTRISQLFWETETQTKSPRTKVVSIKAARLSPTLRAPE